MKHILAQSRIQWIWSKWWQLRISNRMLHLLVSYSLLISNSPDKSFDMFNLCSPNENISFSTLLAATLMNAESGCAAKSNSNYSPATTSNTDGKNPRIAIWCKSKWHYLFWLFWIPLLFYFNLAVLIFLVSVHYIKHPSMGCFDTRGALPILTSKNLNDAKIECSKHPQCYMFRDKCGDESEFSYCTKTATLKTSKTSCGSNLYRPGNFRMWHLNYCINI